MPVRTLAFLLLALLTALVPARPAAADGKVFYRTLDPASIVIPDQEALIHFADGVQTLVIETRFRPPAAAADAPADEAAAAAPSYAWVVPLPASGGVPEVFPATRGLFPTLRAIFSPRIEARGPPAEFGVGLIVCALILIGIMATRSWVTRFTSWVVLLFVLSLLVILLLPALGKARSGASGVSPADGVAVLDRRIVGSFDVAIVAATDERPDAGMALAAWLNGHGFGLPAGVEPVLADYASRGWCFAAAKLHTAAPDAGGDGPLTPHPLGFRFRTAEPVYPLKLTGVGNGPLKVDLYVFGDRGAAADGFTVVRSAPAYIEPETASSVGGAPAGAIVVAHDGLRGFVPGAAYATKLSGTLSPEQMTSDLVLRWTPPRDVGGVWYTDGARAGRALTYPGAGLFLGALLIGCVCAARREPGRRAAKWSLALIVPAAVAGAAIYFGLPPVEGKLVRGVPGWYAHGVLQHVFMLATDQGGSRSIDEARERLAAALQTEAKVISDPRAKDDWRTRIVLSIREEDSPGNYLLTEEPEGSIGYFWFDPQGRKHILGTARLTPAITPR